ncbi:MAG: decaprenyl-phosphate phosphoribosyltransferase [Acidimicrobiaceae bacterium]|jgi:decaprenyl-phosphate phosphoribosyltransferase|nr:decaprenyl-phosphate phosphoribosyltransferase [Acidimicrobiaceae bacterium]
MTAVDTIDRGTAIGLLESMRPRQWVKNGLVFAAPAASGILGSRSAILRSAYAAMLFIVVSSAMYLLNDLADIAADRLHPRKRLRPIAAGAVSGRAARATCLVLSLAGLAGATALGWRFLLVVGSYVVISTAYSLGLKRCAVVELLAVASGFVLRAIGGAEAVGVDASVWFVLTTSFAALFVVTGKRLSEALEFGADVVRVRATSEVYPAQFLRFALAVAASASIVVYCLWAFSASDLEGSAVVFFELSVVPVAAALLRYALLVELGHGGAPEDVFLSDRSLQVLGLIWIGLFGFGIYLR